MRAEAWEGMQFVWKDRRLRALTESTVIFNFCANGAFAVYLVYAVRSLGLSPAAIGIIFSLGNVGWLAGALVAARCPRSWVSAKRSSSRARWPLRR